MYGGTLEDPPPCYRCGQPAESVDHIVPVALGGTDDLDNLRPACVSCNSRDGARLGNTLRSQRRRAPATRLGTPASTTPADKPSSTPPGPAGLSLAAPGKPRRPNTEQYPPKGPEGPRPRPIDVDPDLLGSNTPRLATPQLGVPGGGTPVVEIAGRLGLELMPWQVYTADRLLERRPDGRRRFRTALVTVGRQNGKSFLLRAFVVWWITDHAAQNGPQSVGIVANTRSLAVDQWSAVVRLLEEHVPGAIEKVSRGAGRERVTLVDGSTFQPFAASDAIHGASLDLVLVDEVWDIKPAVLDDGILPTTMARPDPLVAMFSTAGDENSHAMRAWRERGLSELDSTSETSHLLLEWSAGDADDPDLPDTWAKANPGMGRTIRAEALAQAATAPNRAAFYRANLNRWVQSERSWFPVGLWPQLEVQDPDLDPDTIATTAVEQDKSGGTFAMVTARRLVGGRVFVTCSTASTEADLWSALEPRIRAGETVLVPPLFPDRAPYALTDNVRIVGDRELRGWAAYVEQAVTTGIVAHDGSQLLAEQLGRTTARPRDGGLFIGTAVPGASVHSVRAMVWAVAEATRLEKPATSPVIRFA